VTRTASQVLERARKGLGQLPQLGRALVLVWAVAPRLTTVWAGLLVVQGLLPVAAVYLTRALVDSLVLVMGSGGGWARVRAPILLAASLAGVVLLSEVLQAVGRWIRVAQAEAVKDRISTLLHEKAVTADLAYYESPEYFDQLHLIRYEVYQRPTALLENVGALMQNTLTLVAMLVVLVRFGVWVPVALAASTLPALWVVMRSVVRHHEWRVRTTPDERRANYYDWVLTSLENAPEVRLFELGPHFQRLFGAVRARLRRERIELARFEGAAGLGAAAVAFVLGGVTLGWVVWRALHGAFSLGDVAMFYQAFTQGQRLLRTLLETVGQIYANSLFLGGLFAFLALEPRVVEQTPTLPTPTPLTKGIRFAGVSFTYPGSRRAVLRAFTLDIPVGKVVAVVGENGAGKSTLIKLLCRLYDPQEGGIELDGVDIRALSLADLRRQFSVVFQQPVRFNATFAENIALGDLTVDGGAEAIGAAARAAGADEAASRLPQGHHTLLGKWFEGGADMSVGEWQRVALARAFYRQAPVILLDEPTSAMDSWAENDWMSRFRALAEGRTALVITHRFTTAMRADVIHVMHAGRILESGTHRELVALGGRYAASWEAQMRHAAEGPGAR
jgi:ATP-binding cassette subfamily B protein